MSMVDQQSFFVTCTDSGWQCVPKRRVLCEYCEWHHPVVTHSIVGACQTVDPFLHHVFGSPKSSILYGQYCIQHYTPTYNLYANDSNLPVSTKRRANWDFCVTLYTSIWQYDCTKKDQYHNNTLLSSNVQKLPGFLFLFYSFKLIQW